MPEKPDPGDCDEPVRCATEDRRTTAGTASSSTAGVVASHAYGSDFPEHGPSKVPNDEAYERGSRAASRRRSRHSSARPSAPRLELRAAIYEFQYEPVLTAFKVACDAGADVQDRLGRGRRERRRRKHDRNEEPRRDREAGIKALCSPRENCKDIAHNKFIVLLEDGEPSQVWTGSTNITDGGIFGHSNVGHQRARPQGRGALPRLLEGTRAKIPLADPLKGWTVDDVIPPEETPEQMLGLVDPQPPEGGGRAPSSARATASKRSSGTRSSWKGRKSSVFLTAAFGVSKQLQTIFAEDVDYLRYLLLDNRDGKIDTVARGIEADSDNLVVAGAFIGENSSKDGWNQWAKEALTGLNNHVQYIHTKYMLIDPLGDDPIVITGSANFSDASTADNDENMLVIRGDTRVADIYLGEFMRLFTHFRLRGRVNAPKDKLLPVAGVAPEHVAEDKIYLKGDSSWVKPAYVSGSPEEKERLLFSGA